MGNRSSTPTTTPGDAASPSPVNGVTCADCGCAGHYDLTSPLCTKHASLERLKHLSLQYGIGRPEPGCIHLLRPSIQAWGRTPLRTGSSMVQDRRSRVFRFSCPDELPRPSGGCHHACSACRGRMHACVPFRRCARRPVGIHRLDHLVKMIIKFLFLIQKKSNTN